VGHGPLEERRGVDRDAPAHAAARQPRQVLGQAAQTAVQHQVVVGAASVARDQADARPRRRRGCAVGEEHGDDGARPLE
jgi:hypothetical protein